MRGENQKTLAYVQHRRNVNAGMRGSARRQDEDRSSERRSEDRRSTSLFAAGSGGADLLTRSREHCRETLRKNDEICRKLISGEMSAEDVLVK
jgi:hypothetical protein